MVEGRLPFHALFALGMLSLSGCAMGANPIDNAIKTNAISLAEPAPSIAPDPFTPSRTGDGASTDRLLDEDTMRLAVTTADTSRIGNGALPWANAATGASGDITSISETRTDGQTCRRFNATRQAYDGVTFYNGEVCLDPGSGWWTKSLAPKNAPITG